MPPTGDRDAPILLTPDRISVAVAEGFGQMIPTCAAEIAAALPQIPCVLDPDTVERLSGGRRALTLEDGGNKTPVVLCPFSGRLRDGLTLAHELGHALQYQQAQDSVAPVMREVAAFLAELALIRGLGPGEPDIAARLRQYWEYQTWYIFHSVAAALLQALDKPAADYDYAWNYPIARMAALRLAPPDSAPDAAEHAITGVLNGTLELRDILSS